MIKNGSKYVLMIEPHQPGTAPLVDRLTRKVTAAWRARRTSEYSYRGTHDCTSGDGASSDARDHWVRLFDGTELMTNSLCVHYVACHRPEVSAEEAVKIEMLPDACVDLEPTLDELRSHDACELFDAAPAGAAPILLGVGDVALAEVDVDGIRYHIASSREGWSSGHCATPSAAVGRVLSYHAGLEISELPDGQASIGEMNAVHAFMTGADLEIVAAALDGVGIGIGSAAWCRASATVCNNLGTPGVLDAIRALTERRVVRRDPDGNPQVVVLSRLG